MAYTVDDWYVHQDMLDSALYWLMTPQQQALLGNQGITGLTLCLCRDKPTNYDEAYTVFTLTRSLVSLAGTRAIEPASGDPGGRWILLRTASLEDVPMFTIVSEGTVRYAALVGVYQGENTFLFMCPAEGEIVEDVPMIVNAWCISITYPYQICEVPEEYDTS